MKPLNLSVYLDTHDWTVGVSMFTYKVHQVEIGRDITLHLLAVKVLIRL